MTPVSYARSVDDYSSLQTSKTPPEKDQSGFPAAFKVAAANTPVKPDGQYGEWVALSQKSDGTSAKTAVSFNSEDSVILTATYKNIILSEGVMGYGDMERVFLPLGDTARMMDFNIRANPGAGTADGWFISEDRHFFLDLFKGTAVVDGKTMGVNQENVKVADGEIFVDSDMFSRWFPVDFNYDFHQQSIELIPREPLPFQAMTDRNARRGFIGKNNINESSLPRMEDDYNFIEPLTADITLQGSHESGKERDNGFQGEYSVLARGDVGKMSADLFFSGDDENGLENSRITLERGDPDGNLLGPLNATHVAVGDVRVPNFPIQSGGRNEIGGTITNVDLNRTRDFDTTHFEGDLPPGWDVEVYRNGNLVGSERVGPDGRYDFEVALFYGKNDFELVFYGPQGQKRTETKLMNVGQDLLRKGEGEYQVSVTAKDSTLVDPDGEYRSRDQDSMRVVGLYEYGLSESLSLGGGVQSQEVDGLRRNYINAAVKATLGPLFAGGEYVRDTRGGDAGEVFIQTGGNTRLGPVDLRLKQELFNNFTDENTSDADPVKLRSSLSLSGELEKIGRLSNIPYTLTYSRIQKEASTENRLSSNLGINFGQTYFNNRLDWSDGLGEGAPELEGEFRTTSYLDGVRLRGAMGYQLSPDSKVEDIALSTQFSPMEDLSTELIARADFRDEDSVGGGVRLNWNSGKYILSPQVSYDSNGEFLATLALTTSIGVDPRKGNLELSSQRQADTGRISARVYHDRNNNNVFDEGDTAVKGAEVSAAQAYRKAQTDEEGIAVISGLKKYKPTDVVVKEGSLADPFMSPAGDGVSLVPRPGHTALVDIPVIMTGEIEGTVSLASRSFEGKPMTGARLQLVDSEGTVVDETRSEFDGFYLFMKVPPGNYSVRLDPDHAGRLGVNADIKEGIEIDNDGGVVGGLDLVARKVPSAQARADTLPAEQNMVPLSGTAVSPAEETVSAIENAAPVTSPILNPVLPPSVERFGIHLSSYRSPEKAVAGISYLKKQFPEMLGRFDYTVQKVDLGPEKGEWFRVVAGKFDSREAAADLERKIRMAGPYCQVMALQEKKGAGVHLTSYRTAAKAKQGIEQLKARYPDLLAALPFIVKMVDLGSDKGIWHRVIAGNFTSRATAGRLAEKIKISQPYTKVVAIENKENYGIHLASYRDLDKAAKGLALLEKKLGRSFGDGPRSIRRVDLGDEKGVWYRVMAGRFEDREDAVEMQKRLAGTGQYAKVMGL